MSAIVRMIGLCAGSAALVSSAYALEPVPAPTAGAQDAGRAPAAAGPQGDAVVRKLKAALMESSTKLGASGQLTELAPWQKRLFDEEALPQYQRFIKHYRSPQTHSASAISSLVVDIDVESLKNYLRFYAPQTLGREPRNAPALVYLKAEAACLKCTAAGPALRALVQARVERRGLSPVWITAEELGPNGAELDGKALEDKLTELATARNAAASLVLQWGAAPPDDVDTAHADENHYVLKSRIEARGLAGTGRPGAASSPIVAKTENSASLLETDSFEAIAIKLLSDAFVELGAQSQKAELAQVASRVEEREQSELRLDVVGFRGFTQYSELKTQVAAKFPDVSLEERRISRGRVVLALVGEPGTPEQVRTALAGMKLEGGHGRLVLGIEGPKPASSMDSAAHVTIPLEVKP
jgi:hypothetical protein